MNWNVVAGGDRNGAYRRLRAALDHDTDTWKILPVDSEAPVVYPPPRHSRERGDPWSLDDVEESQVQLMVQTMETWTVADPDALASWYGQHFSRRAALGHILPRPFGIVGVRARAAGFVYSWSRLSVIFNSFIIAFVLGRFGTGGVFALIAAAMLVVIATVGIFGPRTKNLALEQISS